jgi:dihydrofolate reductase
MKISIISAIGKNNEIGKKNDLLWSLPADMKHFRETTRGHAVVMGQKTFESLAVDENGKQIGRLLPNRRNIILTLDKNFKAQGAEIVYSIEELIDLLKKETPSPLGHSPLSGGDKVDKEIFIIGGGMIYKLFIDLADKLYITHVNEEFPDAEIFFPEIDLTKWQKIKSIFHSADAENKYDLEFAEYIRK